MKTRLATPPNWPSDPTTLLVLSSSLLGWELAPRELWNDLAAIVHKPLNHAAFPRIGQEDDRHSLVKLTVVAYSRVWKLEKEPTCLVKVAVGSALFVSDDGFHPGATARRAGLPSCARRGRWPLESHHAPQPHAASVECEQKDDNHLAKTTQQPATLNLTGDAASQK